MTPAQEALRQEVIIAKRGTYEAQALEDQAFEKWMSDPTEEHADAWEEQRKLAAKLVRDFEYSNDRLSAAMRQSSRWRDAPKI
jgi:hypothetical protein